MLTSHRIQRAQFLLEQRRYELAEAEFRAHLASFPDDPHARAQLARCLAGQNQMKPALTEARGAVASAPDFGYAHIILAEILSRMDKEREAEKSALQAVRLDPENASYFGLLGQIQLHLGNPKGALATAEAGLAIDAESNGCANIRALALTKLGRADDAAAVGRATLERDPLDSHAHASLGWVLLEQGRQNEALTHFREALRLEPGMEWARNGMLHALRARYRIYRWMLAWSFFLGRFNQQTRYAIIFGLYAVSRLAYYMGSINPKLSILGAVIMTLYGLFWYLTWTSKPLFNSLLRFSPYGRMLLTRQQIVTSTWYAAYALCGIVGIALGLILQNVGLAVIGIGSLLMSVLVDVIANTKPLWFKRCAIALGAVLTIAIIAGGIVVGTGK